MLFICVYFGSRNFCRSKRMADEKCSVCSRKVSAEKFHVCPNCERRSHSKCIGVEPKFLGNVWLCKLCRQDALPNFEFSDELPLGKNISHLKSYFKHLNTMSNSFSNFDSQLDDQRDDNTYDDRISSFNCKYYSTREFFLLKNRLFLAFILTLLL